MKGVKGMLHLPYAGASLSSYLFYPLLVFFTTNILNFEVSNIFVLKLFFHFKSAVSHAIT
jgi:hypothetical protein